MKRSMSSMRSLSAWIQGEGTRSSRHSTSRMWPVSPMPPMVARKRSGSASREHSTMRPSATRILRERTCPPNDPVRWWLLPWTSAATIPPSVMNWVPGATGSKNPRGRKTRFTSKSDSPASARRTPVAWSKARMRSARRDPATTGRLGGGSDESP
jgi:hypothetical protein